MHSYVGGLLVVAGADCGVGGSGDVAGSMKSELVLRHRMTWITAWQRTAAYHVWAAGLRRLQHEQQQDLHQLVCSWPHPQSAGPEEIRRAAVVSSPREMAGSMGSMGGGAVYGAVAGVGWGVCAAMGGAKGWVSWAVGGSGDGSHRPPPPPVTPQQPPNGSRR